MHARALYFTVITNLNFITKIVKLYVAAHFIQVLKKIDLQYSLSSPRQVAKN